MCAFTNVNMQISMNGCKEDRMNIKLTAEEVNMILNSLARYVEGLRYDLDGGWIDDEDERAEAEQSIVDMNALWDKLFLIYRKAIRE